MINENQKKVILSKMSLSLLTTPFLLSLITIEGIVEGLNEIGQASEEVFRGVRLPILHLSDVETDKN